MDNTGSLQVSDAHNGAKTKTTRMSYEFRAGQVRRVLELNPEMTIYDLARYLEMSPRQMHTICERMAKEGRISARQVPHRKGVFKHIISLVQP